MANKNYKKNDENKTSTGRSRRRSSNPRAKRNTNNGSNSLDRDYRDSTTRRESNDASWYTNNMALVNDAGSFSFNNAMGTIIPSVLPNGEGWIVPGVLTYTVQMTPGISNDPYSPINIAARALYDRVNYKNSRNFSYDAPDLMMYVYGASSAYAYWAFMVRIYGIMNTYSQINRYVPDALVISQGVDPDAIRSNMAQFRYYINLYARKINVLAIPAGMPLFNRYMWLYSNVYMDSDNRKAGLYISRPYGFYEYLEKTTKGGACHNVLWNFNLGSKLATFSDIVAYGNNIAERLLASQDINNMSTDILKAYEGQVTALPDITPDYFVTPQYNLEVLQQIHNATAFGEYVIDAPSTGSDGVVTLGSSGNLIQDPTTGYLNFTLDYSNDNTYNSISNGRVLFDVAINDPTPSDIFVASRMTTIFEAENHSLKAAGSDIVIDYRVLYISGSTKKVGMTTSITNYNHIDSTDTVRTMASKINQLNTIHQFDWSPMVYLYIYDQTNSTFEYVINGPLSDVFNTSSLDSEELRKLHEAALLSMFTIPGTLGSK